MSRVDSCTAGSVPRFGSPDFAEVERERSYYARDDSRRSDQMEKYSP